MSETFVNKTPVLVIAFNRVRTLEKVCASLREARPPRLYFSVDGPRISRPDDIAKVEAVRAFIETSVDWPCKVEHLFHDTNQGCKKNVAGALRWFFAHEEDGIVLEDDIVPDPSFFRFCQEMLEKYRSDTRIGMISGYNKLQNISCRVSYRFATGGAISGWATWRRVAASFTADEPILDSPYLYHHLLNATDDSKESRYISRTIFRVRNSSLRENDGWDFAWGILLKINSQLAVVSAVNLIDNVGEGEDAFHPSSPFGYFYSNVPVGRLSFPLEHPECIVADKAFSRRQGAQHYHGC